MFVEMCVGLGFLDHELQLHIARSGVRLEAITSWGELLCVLQHPHAYSGLLNSHLVGLLSCGPGPWVKIPDIQTAALVEYLGEQLGWPPLDG